MIEFENTNRVKVIASLNIKMCRTIDTDDLNIEEFRTLVFEDIKKSVETNLINKNDIRIEVEPND